MLDFNFFLNQETMILKFYLIKTKTNSTLNRKLRMVLANGWVKGTTKYNICLSSVI